MQIASIIVLRILGLVGTVITASEIQLGSAGCFRGRSSNAFKYNGGAAWVGKGGTLRKDSESVVQDGSRRGYDRRSSKEPLPSSRTEFKSIEEQEPRAGRTRHCCLGASGETRLVMSQSESAPRGTSE